MKVRAHSGSPLHYQVSIEGPASSKLSRKLATEIVEMYLAEEDTEPFHVRVKIWRGGEELDWRSDNPRAELLRKNLRRYLHDRSLAIGKMGD